MLRVVGGLRRCSVLKDVEHLTGERIGVETVSGVRCITSHQFLLPRRFTAQRSREATGGCVAPREACSKANGRLENLSSHNRHTVPPSLTATLAPTSVSPPSQKTFAHHTRSTRHVVASNLCGPNKNAPGSIQETGEEKRTPEGPPMLSCLPPSCQARPKSIKTSNVYRSPHSSSQVNGAPCFSPSCL